MICLGATDTKEKQPEGILNLLSTLLSSEIPSASKKQILAQNYGIPMTKELNEEIENMCNYGEYIEKRALARGLSKG